MDQLYLEYEILQNRPGLLGDVASLIGMLKLDILTVSSIENNRRGFLLSYENEDQLESLRLALMAVQDLEIKIFHPPHQFDRLTLKHGKRIYKYADNPPIYRFFRKDLDYLIDFLGEILNQKPDILIGFQGSPGIGKSETCIAACVHANKPWILISSTLLRKIARISLDEDIYQAEPVLIIDAITTFYRSFPEHINFVKNILTRKVPRIVEHPQILIRETNIRLRDFDLIVELYLTEDDNQEVDYVKGQRFNSFDIS